MSQRPVRRREEPPGTRLIKVPDPHNPERLRTVASENDTSLFIWRRGDNWHYEIPKARILGEAWLEIQNVFRAEARRRGLLVEDVLKDVATLTRDLFEVYAHALELARARGCSVREVLEGWKEAPGGVGR